MVWVVAFGIAFAVLGIVAVAAAVRSSQKSEALRRAKAKGPVSKKSATKAPGRAGHRDQS